MRRPSLIAMLLLLPTTALIAEQPRFPGESKRILFLGDSITHAGHYISMVEAHVRSARPGSEFEMINLGLPSETCSGLSEPDHPFPRPNVHERLVRALTKIQPDLVVACYGMNDGIYYPFSEKRFAAYQAGIQRIINAVKKSGARLILMSPPPFDPLPLRRKGELLPKGEEKYAWFRIYENYDTEVLKPYADWVMKQSAGVAMTIDLHTPVNAYVAAKRAQDPEFSMSGDGVHMNVEGHRVLADAILKAWGYDTSHQVDDKLMQLVGRRQQMMHAAYVSHVGHKRPGVKAGLPLEEARKEAASFEQDIKKLLSR